MTTPSPPRSGRVAVIGGGISGLAAAYEVRQRAGTPVRIDVFEASDRLGGKLRAVELGDRQVDAGAESVITRRPEGVSLIEEIGWGNRLRSPAATGASLWINGALHPLPRRTMLGIPYDLRAVAASGVLSVAGLLRMPFDSLLPATSFEPGQVADDIAVGRLVAERLGDEVLDRLVEPVLAGVYAGHADDLSLAAVLPQLAREVQVRGSLVASAAHLAAAAAPSGPAFASLDAGLWQLPDAVASAAQATVHLASPIAELQRDEEGWTLRDPAGAAVAQADVVIIATPAGAAAQLLRHVCPKASQSLSRIEYASVAIVSFLVGAVDVPPRLPGTGFLVPPSQDTTIKAATFSSHKWGDASRVGELVFRCSVGRFGETRHLDLDDAELAQRAWHELCAATGITNNALAATVSRWPDALPQYRVGHLDQVADVTTALDDIPGLAVCGAALEGVGIAACVASGQAAAQRALPVLTSAGRSTGRMNT